MPEKKKKKRGLLSALSSIGGGVVKTGEAAKRLGGAVKPSEKGDEVSKRLAEIKRLETLKSDELGDERRKLDEEFREELKMKGEKIKKEKVIREQTWERRLKEEEVSKEIRTAEEESKWDERALKRPASARFSEMLIRIFEAPAQRLAGSFKGIRTDLYRANINTSPERFAAMVLGESTIAAVVSVVFLLMLRMSIIIVILGAFMVFGMCFMLMKSGPKRKAKARSGGVNRLLPYGLRHMATQLSSGIGLPETMTSVSNAGYGPMSEEFARAIHDMNTGLSLEEALAAMDERVNSESLRRALRQIQRTLRTGGDLSHTLNTLADETSFEMRSKLRDYVQSLNMFTLMYMFMSAVIPAMLMIVVMISSSGGKQGITPSTAGVLFLLLLPFLLVYVVIMIKRFEPRL